MPLFSEPNPSPAAAHRYTAPVAQMAEDFPDTAFLKVDVDDQAEIAAAANVRAMPTFHFMRGGKLLEDNPEIVGADPGKLLQYVQHHTK